MKQKVMIISLLATLCLAGCAKKQVVPDSFSDIKTQNDQGKYKFDQTTSFKDYSINKERYIDLSKSPDNKKIVSSLRNHTKDNVVFNVQDYQKVYTIRYDISQGYQKYAKDHYPELLSSYNSKTTFIGAPNTLSYEKNKLVGIDVVRAIAQQVISQGVPQNPKKQLFTESIDKSKLIYRIQSQLDAKYPDIFTITTVDTQPLH